MTARKSSSIRERLLYSFFLTAALMCIMIIYSFLSFNSIAISISNAYQTNINLDEFQVALGAVESSMENYVSLRTFESIENYYSWRGRLDDLAGELNVSLSSDPVLLLEYKVRRLMETFLEYADKTVYARRGNNVKEYIQNYGAALRVYGYLSDSVNDLNGRYFSQNISGYNRMLHKMKSIETLNIVILILVIAVNFLMVYILINRITGPLVELSRAANKVAEGHFDIELLGIQSQDEVGNICRAFDRMTVSIREYIETIQMKAEVENRLRRQEMDMRELYKDAQLKTLQSQINPHFLFNTLNAGAQLAMMEGADDTCTFIEKTADFFRYNIQNMNKNTVLDEELTLVDNYMYIMQVRFADRVLYKKSIECDTRNIPLPSMILQPLVENSIKHGISSMNSGGTIKLRVFRDDGTLYIEVSDNGCGIEQDVRDRLLRGSSFYEHEEPGSELPPSVGLGMTNVITRLRIFFDDPEIFDIRSNTSEPGTTFSIRIRNV